MGSHEVERVIGILKSLGDKSRLRALMSLADFGELCVCEITELLELSAATVSRHMSLLQKAGVVKSRKDGRWVHYGLSGQFPEELLAWLKECLNDEQILKKDKERMAVILKNKPSKHCKRPKNMKK